MYYKLYFPKGLQRYIAFAILSLSFTYVHAQQVWSMEKCVNTALENNLTIKSANLNLENNAVEIKSANHARYPNLSVGSDVYWNFGRTIDPTSNSFTTETFFRNGLSLNTGATLFNGFAINNTIKQANTNKEALQQDLEQIKRDIALNVATYYLNALFAKENLIIANSNLALTKNSLSQIQTMVKLGSKAPNETLDIEAQLATDEQNVLVANNSFINAKMQLRQLMLVNEDFDVQVPNVTVNNETALMQFDELYNAAVKNHHGIMADGYRVKSAGFGVKIAEGQRYPSINVGGNLGTNYSNQGKVILGSESVPFTQEVFIDNNPAPINITSFRDVPIIGDSKYFNQFDQNLSYGVGFSVNMPILTNYRTTAGIEKAKIARKNAELSLETKKQTLAINVQQSLTDANAAKLKLAASEKALTANQAAFDNANKKFALGSITSFDLINARTRLDNAKNNLLIAKYDHIFKVKVLDFYLGKGISL
jgi:outer membrane protein